eukprot:3779212-Amphidinium_carterae.1
MEEPKKRHRRARTSSLCMILRHSAQWKVDHCLAQHRERLSRQLMPFRTWRCWPNPPSWSSAALGVSQK